MQLLQIPENIVADMRRYNEYRQEIVRQFQPHIRAIAEMMNSQMIKQALGEVQRVAGMIGSLQKNLKIPNNFVPKLQPHNEPEYTVVDDTNIGTEAEIKNDVQENLKPAVIIASKRFIYCENGKFYCKGKEISSSEDSFDLLFVKALYFESDSDGFCSYNTIERLFVDHGKPRRKDYKKMKKRVQNAYRNLFRPKITKEYPFPQKTPDGKLIIKTRAGRGYIFNNPEI